MKIEIQLDEKAEERKIIIVTEAVDEEIENLMRQITWERLPVLAGFSGERAVLLEQEQIIRIYASGGKVLAVAEQGEFALRLRLYELEERLDKCSFVRISNSEIVNLRQVKNFDLSYTGTIRVSLSNGESAFVSRRYVSRIKKTLGL